MTKKDKELLLKDLCTRLPYEVEVHIKGEYKTPRTIFSIHIEDKIIGYFKGLSYNEELIENVKPYLRPMSSMTEEEASYLSKLKVSYGKDTFKWIYDNLDYLNSRHLDYRNLIEKGLALEAPEDMYKI